MIQLLTTGKYSLIETKGQTKILSLGDQKRYAWITVADIGEILVTSHHPHRIDHLLAQGNYRLYNVKDEKSLTDLEHLELFVGDGLWQGYLLPTGLPTDEKKRARILPTQEIIATSYSSKRSFSSL